MHDPCSQASEVNQREARVRNVDIQRGVSHAQQGWLRELRKRIPEQMFRTWTSSHFSSRIEPGVVSPRAGFQGCSNQTMESAFSSYIVRKKQCSAWVFHTDFEGLSPCSKSLTFGMLWGVPENRNLPRASQRLEGYGQLRPLGFSFSHWINFVSQSDNSKGKEKVSQHSKFPTLGRHWKLPSISQLPSPSLLWQSGDCFPGTFRERN